MQSLFRVSAAVLMILCQIRAQAGELPKSISTVVDFLMVDYSHVDSVGELSNKVLHGLGPIDRAAISKRILRLKAVPQFRKTVTGFTISSEGTQVHFDLSQIAKRIVRIDGQNLTINPKVSLNDQIEIFLKHATPGKSEAFFSMFIDRAEAIPPAVWVVVAFVGIPLANKVVDYFGTSALDMVAFNSCYLVIDRWGYKGDPDYKFCTGYANDQADKAKRNREVVAAVENKVLIETAAEECPHERSDGKYAVAMYLVNQKKWYFARGEGAGKIEKAVLTTFDTGTHVADYTFANPYAVAKIAFPNPDVAKPDQKEPLPATIEVTPGNKSTDSKFQGLQDLHSGIAGRLVKQLIGCEAKKQQSDASKTRVSEKGSGQK